MKIKPRGFFNYFAFMGLLERNGGLLVVAKIPEDVPSAPVYCGWVPIDPANPPEATFVVLPVGNPVAGKVAPGNPRYPAIVPGAGPAVAGTEPATSFVSGSREHPSAVDGAPAVEVPSQLKAAIGISRIACPLISWGK
jgi:hypothetical protein